MVTDLGGDISNKELLKTLRRRITKYMGKRCPDYHPYCGTCIVWNGYDIIKEASELWEEDVS